MERSICEPGLLYYRGGLATVFADGPFYLGVKMNQDRAFRGIWIPKEIWLSKNLTLQQKVFLVEIDSLDGEDGCYATNEYFAEFFGLSTKRVSSLINSLVEKGLLDSQIDKSRGNKRILKISDRYPRNVPYPIPGKFHLYLI